MTDCQVDVAVTQAAAVSVSVGSASAVTVSVSSAAEVEVEVDVPNMTVEEREKLASIDWGARRDPQHLVRLAYACEKSTGGGGEAGGGGGDSVQWTGTNEFQPTISFLLAAPALRANGYLEFDVTAAFLSGAGTGTVTFKLQRAYTPDVDPGTDPSVFGLPLAFEDVAGLSFTSPAIPAGAGTGVFTFTFRIRATGHAGTSFKHAVGGEMIIENLAGGDPVRRAFVARLATTGSDPQAGLDTTRDMELQLVFRMDPGWTVDGANAFNVTSASAVGLLRSDHPY